MTPPTCYCGSSTTLQSNAVIYGREFGNSKAWVCEKFPVCRGYVGTHPDGRPLGTIPDEETRAWRIKAHDAVDPMWKSRKYKRSTVYKRLSEAFGKPVHIGEATKEECEDIIKTVPLIFLTK